MKAVFFKTVHTAQLLGIASIFILKKCFVYTTSQRFVPTFSLNVFSLFS